MSIGVSQAISDSRTEQSANADTAAQLLMRLGAYQYTAGLLQLVIGHRPDEKSAPQTQSLVRFGSLSILVLPQQVRSTLAHFKAKNQTMQFLIINLD